MADEVRVIKKKDVKPGMYVRTYGTGSFSDPHVEVGRVIESLDDIAKYLPDDTERVEILTGKSLPAMDPSGNKKAKNAEEAARNLADALPEARRVHEEALDYAHKFIEDVRKGKTVEVEEAAPIVGEVIDSLTTNEPAALTLAFLKRYDEYTYTHSINVNLYSLLLGKALGLTREELEMLGIAALFHDVGKGRIPNKVLNKPGKLTDAEYGIMKTHSQKGLEVLRDVEGLDQAVLRGVVEHHERYDGNGYPSGVKGENIHPFGRIIAISDVYDALTSVRVYKKAVTPAKTLSQMYKWKGTDFDPAYLNRFIRVMGIYPPGTMVQLDDLRFGIVLETNESKPRHPKVKVLFNDKMQPVVSECVDLATYKKNGQGVMVMRQPDPSSLGVDMQQLSRFLV
ncbi:HD-GYP domain-containing protein [Desulfovibrio sp. JC010]|uniref:HD-GYP domain-containing protein n=1 Tax=Desulfovibrio sp. JC010 TaxID=2593641 RepID=UPI0013D48CB8|nr:HD-GYP domain-containing protein [Desulfovibrio sp. JC010]